MFSKSTIKYIQSLQQKKFREESGSFVAEGPKLVKELIITGKFNCQNIYATEEWVLQNDKFLKQHAETEITIVKDFELQKLAGYATANKVVAVFKQADQRIDVDPAGQVTLALDGIQDPGNLGTIIRSADWFGVKAIVCSENTADLYNPKVVQSTMASIGRVDVQYRPLKDWLSLHSKIPKYAATLDGKPSATLAGVDEGILVIGNESQGVSEDLLKLVDSRITIPKFGSAESLNAGVATSILLYAMRC